jgi:hypothetical protein
VQWLTCRANLSPAPLVIKATMASKPKHPPGPPMTLGNMRHLGVQYLVAFCLNKEQAPLKARPQQGTAGPIILSFK